MLPCGNAVPAFLNGRRESMNTNRREPLSRYVHPQHNQLFPDVLDDFNEVAKRAPKDVMAQAMAAAFRADEKTSFGAIVAKLFLHSDAELRAALLNMLISHVGRDTKRVLTNAGLFGLDPDSRQVSEETTAQLLPEAIGHIAAEAEQRDSRTVDEVSALYARHTQVVRKLGAHAVVTVLTQIAQKTAMQDL
jgi:hypothetical protein